LTKIQLYAKISIISRTAVKKLFVALASIFALSAMAQSSDWKLTAVPGPDRGTVGYIYHTSAVGTQIGAKAEKIVTGLRLVCTATGFTANKNSEPVIALYWNTMTGSTPQFLGIKVDSRQVGVGQETRWVQDGPLLLRTIEESSTLLQSMKTGNKISFEWTGTDAVRRSTIFDLRDFRSNLNEFNTVCKTQI
jgi:hypothetical protein